ncbi:TPA: hypothetical protein HNC72_14230 [Escherichia coli]|nr:hypothetical protein [Escherichia coli]
MRRGYHHTGCRYQNRRRRQNDGCKREGFAGDTFTPRQDAIMAREIQKLRAAMIVFLMMQENQNG